MEKEGSRARVSVAASVLRWAVNRSASAVKVEQDFPKLSRWLDGEARPTLRQLEDFARATATPLGSLLLPEPPEERLPIPLFRTGQRESPQPSADLLQVVQMMQQRQEWMREYLIDLGRDPLPFVGSSQLPDGAERIAREMTTALDLLPGWAATKPSWAAALRELQSRIEDAGITLVVNSVVGNNTHRRLDPDEFRGFVLVDDYAPMLFVNGADGKAAQMFTLAHELAHVWLRSSAAFDLRQLHPADDATERACDRAAAEFLVPSTQLFAVWPGLEQDSSRYQELARLFKVSEIVIARRALDLALIDKREFFAFYGRYIDAVRSHPKEGGGGDFYSTQNLRLGRRFAESVMQAAQEGRLLYRDAYRLTGLKGAMFERYATRILGEAP